MTEQKISFDEGLQQLEALARRLEQELPLEEALRVYEEAVALEKQLRGTLEAAEKRVQVLIDGEATEHDDLV